MTNSEVQNNFDPAPLYAARNGSSFERNKLVLTLTFTVISLFILGIQLLPYFYGGSAGHFHSSGMCGWPNDCSKINPFSYHKE